MEKLSNFMKPLRVAILVCLVIFPLSMVKVDAAEYSIVFKGGAHGTVNGQNTVNYNVQSGDVFPDEPTVAPKDGYVFSGWSKQLPAVGSTVQGKQVYVAKYDVLVDGISYIVRYVDQNGAQITTPKTMMGENGKTIMERAKTVPGYKYIQGSQEFVLSNTTKEIKFVYELTNIEEVIRYEEEVVNVVTPTPGTQGTQNNNNNNATDNGNTENVPEDETPKDKGDETVKDDETPLSKGESSDNNILLYGGIGAGLLVLLAIVLVIKKHKKES